MKRMILSTLLIICAAASANAQKTATATSENNSFKADGTAIVIPPPTDGIVEVGYENREIMEVFVPTSNRLIAAFVPSDDLSRLTSDNEDLVLSKYGMVEVLRRGEYIDIDARDFRGVTSSMKKQFGETIDANLQDVEIEFNRRMRSLDLDELNERECTEFCVSDRFTLF